MAQNMLIQDHRQTILTLLREGEGLLASIDDQERSNDLRTLRSKAATEHPPTIMFYGLYNAGKSSIINALFQSYTAPVGDVPTTTTIQELSWEGYTLIDTPGIDAHTDHTEIAEKEIRKSDVILFVMDNADTFDNALVYQAIVKILDMGKPLAVVINQKHVDEDEDINTPVPDQKLMRQIVGKVSLNLETQGKNTNTQMVIERKNFLGIFPVNAAYAYSASEINDEDAKGLMLRISGINELKNALDVSIRRSQQIYQLQTPLINLRDVLREVAAEYQKNPIYGEKQGLAKNREILLRSRQNLHDQLISDGLRKIEAALEQVKDAAANGQPVGDVSQKLSAELNALLQEAAQQESAELKTKLNMEAMPGYQPVDTSAVTSSVDEDIKLEDLAAFAPIIVEIPGIPVPIPVDLILKLAGIIIGLFKQPDDAKRAADESQQKLANYYRWLNELRDQEIKIKADYEKTVNDFLSQVYDSKLDEIDRILAEVDNSCVEHTKKLRELEQLQLRVSDEMVALSTL